MRTVNCAAVDIVEAFCGLTGTGLELPLESNGHPKVCASRGTTGAFVSSASGSLELRYP